MKHLHIIAFDIPLPANYGGAIDVFIASKLCTNRAWLLRCIASIMRVPTTMN